jgi:hypothetical protein
MKLSDEEIQGTTFQLQIGMIVSIHKKTGEKLIYPDPISYPKGEFEEVDRMIEKVENSPEEYYPFRAMASRNAYQVMENFADNIEDPIYKGRFHERLNPPQTLRQFQSPGRELPLPGGLVCLQRCRQSGPYSRAMGVFA